MSTINATGAATTVAPSRNWQGDRFGFLLVNEIDFSRVSSGQLFATQADNADVVQVLRVGPGWGVMWVANHVTTAFTGASTITANVGDGSGADSWDAAIDLTSTGYYISAVGTDAYAIGSPHLYSTEDTIDFTLTVSGGDGGPIDTGVVVVMAWCVDLSQTGFGRPAVV